MLLKCFTRNVLPENCLNRINCFDPSDYQNSGSCQLFKLGGDIHGRVNYLCCNSVHLQKPTKSCFLEHRKTQTIKNSFHCSAPKLLQPGTRCKGLGLLPVKTLVPFELCRNFGPCKRNKNKEQKVFQSYK